MPKKKKPTIQVMAARLRKLKDEKADYAAKTKEINKEILGSMTDKGWQLGLEERLAEVMEEEGIKNIKIDGIGTVYLQEDVRPSVDDEAKLFAWLKKTKRGSIIKQTVNFQTLRGLCNELKSEFKPLPEGVSTNDKTVARIRRSKK